MNDFVALDVETANPDFASICQIGIAYFAEGRFLDKWESLVNPEDDFDPFNVRLHGINAAMVAGAPTFPQVSAALLQKLGGDVVIHHTAYDRTAMGQVFRKHSLDLPQIKWLDNACVVRRTWSDCSRSGYRLESVAARLGIKYQPHNAAEDAVLPAKFSFALCKRADYPLTTGLWVPGNRLRPDPGVARHQR